MHVVLVFSAVCLLGACAPFPQDPNAPVRETRYTTGSNLPRGGQADTIDREAVQNQLRLGGSGVPGAGTSGR